MPPLRFADARVVVTGAAQGIGATIAARFAAEGARLVLLDRQGDQVRERAAALGEGALGLPVDLRDPADVRRAGEQALATLGGCDVCVNNAGIFAKAPLLDITVEAWDAMFEVNTRSMLLTTQVLAPAMIAQGRGRIVNMASMAAKAGTPGEAHYAASKAAVVALTRIAAKELGPHGITVNAVCPGYVLTEMGAATRTAEQVAAWTALSPLGRLATPDDVADVVLFLASDQGGYTTGQALNVTGGMVMH
jgi:NAD(P)-dependent dehydrogenase (short-subunit alcohol dehydrogenase family)